MSDSFSNVYADLERAEAYAELEFPGTYFLAFRDLPTLIRKHVPGRIALDFGCGTGRSTRFLRDLGFDVLGVDVAAEMLERARGQDPGGRYELVGDGDLSRLPMRSFDLILAAFTFDNIPTLERKQDLLTALSSLLPPTGRFVNLVSDPAIYMHEWASFSTRDFPANRLAKSGDRVRIIMLDVPDKRPVEDVVCSDADYRHMYARAGLVVHEMHQPLGRLDEGIAWVSETTVAPWSIYVLGSSAPPSGFAGHLTNR
jgi:SAM-dependent methyltransferase